MDNVAGSQGVATIVGGNFEVFIRPDNLFLDGLRPNVFGKHTQKMFDLGIPLILQPFLSQDPVNLHSQIIIFF